MANALVQTFHQSHLGNASLVYTTSSTFTTTTAGSLLVLHVSSDSNKAVSSITDTAGNTYVQADPGLSDYWLSSIWYCANAASVNGSSGTFSITMSASTQTGVIMQEFSGLGATPTVSTTGSRKEPVFANTTSWGTCSTSGSATAGDLVVMSMATDQNSNAVGFSTGTVDFANGFDGGNPGHASAYVLSASAGVQSFSNTLTNGGDGGQVIACFTPSGGGGGGAAVKPRLTLMGVGM